MMRPIASILRWTTILTTILIQSHLVTAYKDPNGGQRKDPREWNFITLADYHGAEKFVMMGRRQFKNNSSVQGDIDTIRYIKNRWGGEFVLMPGDSQGGHWDNAEFIQKFQPGLTPQDSVLAAGHKCYTGMKDVFARGGYDVILMAVGDHELGGNAWHERSLHLSVMPQFRQAFTEAFMKNDDGSLKFDTKNRGVMSRPWGTIFEDTSYFYVHKNVLFVTVDAFHNVNGETFFDPELGIGGEGAVTCTVTGDHLEWFKNVLVAGEELRQIGRIAHVFVQAHDPILQPVRRINSSGQFMDQAEHSEFWQTMREYKVDIYFSGEVHDNTVTVDPYPGSNLVQVVSRGNGFSNLLNVKVTDTLITIDQFNEVGPLPKYNGDYELKGRLKIDKANNNKTTITSFGTLQTINIIKPILRFTFDKHVPLQNRQVVGLRHGEDKTRLIGRWINIRGTNCTRSMPNVGVFGQQYDAQVGRLGLSDKSIVVEYGNDESVAGKAGVFNWRSRMAVYAMGPHSGGVAISYSTWIKTNKCKHMVLISYADAFANKWAAKRHQFTLALVAGRPMVLFSKSLRLKAINIPKLCKTSQWAHIAVSMPKNSCLASEVEIYVNAKKVQTVLTVPEDDVHLFMTTRGRVSIGGWGHAGDAYSDKMLNSYTGLMDEARVYTRSLKASEIFSTMGERVFHQHKNRLCRRKSTAPVIMRLPNISPWKCWKQCANNQLCHGFETKLMSDGKNYRCVHFAGRPNYRSAVVNASCHVVRQQ